MKTIKILVFICLVIVVLIGSLLGACAKPAPTTQPPAPQQPAPQPPAAQPPANQQPATTTAPKSAGAVPVKFLLTSRGLRAGKGVGTIAVWADEVEKVSNGKIDIVEVISAVPPDAMYDAMVAGAADVYDGGASFNPGRWPLMDIYNLADPFIVCKQPSAAAVELWKLWPELDKEFAPLKILALNCGAPSPPGFGLGLTKKPARSVADLKGMKIGVDRQWRTKRLAAIGATPVGISIFDIYETLQKGIVDGEIIDPEMFSSLKLGEVLKYFVPMGFDYGISFIGINPNSYKTLPPDVIKVLEDAAAKMPGWADSYFTQKGGEGIEAAKKLGLEVIDWTPEEKTKLVGALQPVKDEYITLLNSKGYDGKKMFDTMNQVMAKYK